MSILSIVCSRKNNFRHMEILWNQVGRKNWIITTIKL